MDIDVSAWMNDPTADYRQVLAHMPVLQFLVGHYSDVIMSAMASQITSPTIAYSNRLSMRRSKKTPKLRVTG